MFDLLKALSMLCVPEQRVEGLKRLEMHLPAQAVDALREEISKPAYGYRALGARIAAAYNVLANYTEIHEYCSLNPQRVLKHVRHEVRFLSHLRSYQTLSELSVLDFGAGLFSPLSKSLIYYANGAPTAVAYEPFDVNWQLARHSFKNLFFDMLAHPERYRFSNISIERMRSRLYAIELEALDDPDTHDGARVSFGPIELRRDVNTFDSGTHAFGVIVSSSVLEHVQDVSRELTWMHSIGAPGCTMLHSVDLADHRFGMSNYYPLQFTLDGSNGGGVNGLRKCDYIKILRGSGWNATVVSERSIDIENVKVDNLVPPFERYTRDELRTIHFTFTAERMR